MSQLVIYKWSDSFVPGLLSALDTWERERISFCSMTLYVTLPYLSFTGCDIAKQDAEEASRFFICVEPRSQVSEQTESRAPRGLPEPLLLTSDESGLPRQTHLWDASEPHNKVHGVCDPHAVQLRVEPTRGIPPAEVVQDGFGRGNQVRNCKCRINWNLYSAHFSIHRPSQARQNNSLYSW